MPYTRIGLSTAVLGLASLIGWGCEASVGPNRRSSVPPPPPPEDQAVYRSTENPAAQPYPGEPAPYRRDDRIPDDARTVGERLVLGEPADTGLFYEPREDGRIFVRDEDTGRVIYSGPVRGGQQFWLNMTRERATVDGHTVFQAPLRTGDKYQLYFQER